MADEAPPSPDELAAAESLRRALEGESPRAPDGPAPGDDDAPAAALIAAAAGRAPKLGDVATRAIIRRATAEAAARRSAGPAVESAAKRSSDRAGVESAEQRSSDRPGVESAEQRSSRGAVESVASPPSVGTATASGGVRRRRYRWALGGGLSVVAAAAAVLLVLLAPVETPRRLRSRSAGLLVPGPFPADQTAAQRLDVVTTDRMVALREARLYGGRR